MKKHESEDGSRFALLPWLSPEQNAGRRTMHGRLAELWNRTDIPKGRRNDLFAAVRLVRQAEQDILRADDLLHRARNEPLREVDKQQLASLVRWSRHNLPVYRFQLDCELGRLVESRTLSLADAGLLRQSLQQLADSHHYLHPGDQYLHTGDQRRTGVCKRVETSLPADPGKTFAVESRLVSGAALGANFPNGYRSDDRAGAPWPVRFNHVPELAHTTLINDKGQTLFSGVRHGVIHADDLHAELLNSLADDELKALIGNLLILEDSPEPEAATRAERIDSYCKQFRFSDRGSEIVSLMLQKRAHRIMAEEAAAAALVADPYKFQRAIAGEKVDVELFCISLLTPHEVSAWSAQERWFCKLPDGYPLELRLRGPDGAPHSVLADVNVRQFILSAGAEGFGNCVRYGDPVEKAHRLEAVRQLLGPLNSPELGGDVKARVDDMNAGVPHLRSLYDALDQAHSRISEASAADHPDCRETTCRLAGSGDELAYLERASRTLEEAGLQLKRLWLKEEDWPSGVGASRKAAALLALAGYLMHETPLLSCMSGRGFTRQLDSEVKFLAAVADNQDGHLPPVDPDMKVWGPVRGEFSPE